jgi:hypothetical protein
MSSRPRGLIGAVSVSVNKEGKKTMLLRLLSAVALLAVSASAASAQVVGNLSGEYHCVQDCRGGLSGPVFVTQNGYQLNLVNEVGEPSRAWIDWPGHLWAQYWNEGAVYSSDGMTIQFDRGTVWQRGVAILPPPPPPHR